MTVIVAESEYRVIKSIFKNENKKMLIKLGRFDKRINFYQDENYTKIVKGVSFASIYICNNFLPRDLIFEELPNES